MGKARNNVVGDAASSRSFAGSRWLPRAEAASRLGVSIRTLERLALEGDSPLFTRIGRKILYSEGELDRWMLARQVASTSQRGA